MSLLAVCVPDGLAFSWLAPLEPPTLIAGWSELTHAKLADRQFLEPSLSPRELFDVASFDVKFAFGKLEVLEPCDPWPSLYVKWRYARGEEDRLYRPIRRRDLERFEALVIGLVDAATAFAPELTRAKRIRRGWLDHRAVEWELVEVMPTETSMVRDQGAFRTPESGARIVARRERSSAFTTLLAWLASSPSRPWRVTMSNELVLTHEHLYARFHDGSARRIPRSALRKRIGETGEDAIYVFGRGTSVVLTEEPGCPIRAALDAQLALPSERDRA